MNITKFLILALVAIVMTISVVTFFYNTQDVVWFPEATVSFPYTFTVAANPGVDVETDMLRMGAVTYGSTVHRSVTVQHATARAARFRVLGPAADWLIPEQEEVLLVNGTAEVEFILSVPERTPYGPYSGDVIVYLVR